MSVVAWNESWSVGVVELDNQHKEIVRLINELHEIILGGRGDGETVKTLGLLMDAFHVHFAAEEQLMRQSGFPGYPAHKAEHDTFAARVAEMAHELKMERPVLTGELLRLVKAWIEEHVHSSDRQYIPWVKKLTQ